MFKRDDLDKMVQEIAMRETKPIIDVSIDQIAKEIESKVGTRPSKSVIWFSLQRLGAKASGRKFIYRHNPPKGE